MFADTGGPYDRNTPCPRLERIHIARISPEVSLLSFPLEDLLGEMRAQHFGELSRGVTIHFVREGSLACIDSSQERAAIYVHALLNHPETPVEIMRFICKHELLHLVVPPREINGKMVSHTPEFFQREATISPESTDVWIWLIVHFHGCLRRRWKEEKTDVLRTWKKYMNSRRLTLLEARNIIKPEQVVEAEEWSL